MLTGRDEDGGNVRTMDNNRIYDVCLELLSSLSLVSLIIYDPGKTVDLPLTIFMTCEKAGVTNVLILTQLKWNYFFLSTDLRKKTWENNRNGSTHTRTHTLIAPLFVFLTHSIPPS